MEERKKIKGLELVHPEDKKAAREQFAQLLKGVRMSNIEYRLRTKEGSYVSVLSNLTPVLDAEGKIVALQGISRDITDRKRVEEEILRHHRELTALHNGLLAITQTLELEELLKEIVSQVRAALDSAYTSIVLVNQDGSLGVSSEDFVGISPLFSRARPQGVTRRIIATGEPVVIDDVDAVEDTNPILVAAGIKSYAGAPIQVKDTVIGVLFVHSMQRKTFAGSMELLIAFAHQAAIAIENARLYKEASTVGALLEADRLKSELLARVKAVLRRKKFPEEMPQPPFTSGELCIDFSGRQVTVAGKEVVLPPTEYRILCLLARNAGRVITQDHLLTEIWGQEYRGDTHTLQVAIARLRKKIGDDPSNLKYILTRPGIGYTFKQP